MAKSTVEFAVDMTCEGCENTVKNTLSKNNYVKIVDIDFKKQQVIVETILPSAEVQKMIESTGKSAIIKGIGPSAGTNTSTPAGVCMISDLSPKPSIVGVVRFLQINKNKCLIDGTVDGLAPGLHGLHINECGDLSQGCHSLGDHYNPFGKRHGSPQDNERHTGDFGNIKADQTGRATFKFEDNMVNLAEIIGRSLSITERNDDLGKGPNEQSKIDGNSGQRLACGVIARSAGLFENVKKVCACSGATLWEERASSTTTTSSARL